MSIHVVKYRKWGFRKKGSLRIIRVFDDYESTIVEATKYCLNHKLDLYIHEENGQVKTQILI